MKEKLNKLFLIFYVWTIGLVGSLIFLLFKISKRIEIEGYEKWKSLPLLLEKDLRLLVVSNHPSLWEPMVLPLLFSRWYLFFPRAIPFSTPDWKNYYSKWWYYPWKPVSIPIIREGKSKEKERRKSLKKLLQKIRERRIIILFPEGGRTFKGEEFKIIKNDGKIVIERGNWQEVEARFPGMPKIRRFQRGVKGLLKHVQIFLLTWIWIEKKVRLKIRIGEPVQIQNIESIEDLENTLLKLGAV